MRKVLIGATPFASLDYSCKDVVNKVFGGRYPATHLMTPFRAETLSEI